MISKKKTMIDEIICRCSMYLFAMSSIVLSVITDKTLYNLIKIIHSKSSTLNHLNKI